MKNAEFAATDEVFRHACERAGIPPTARQASKYRRGKGKAWKTKIGDEGIWFSGDGWGSGDELVTGNLVKLT